MVDRRIIDVSAETLLRQAPMTVDEYIGAAFVYLDQRFGEGFSQKNPAIVMKFAELSSEDFRIAQDRQVRMMELEHKEDMLEGRTHIYREDEDV